MRNLIVLTALSLLSTPLFATASSASCDASCVENAKAVFKGATHYTMQVDEARHAHILVTWTSSHHPKLKPVTFEGTAPVRLRHTTLNAVEFRDNGNDVCHAVVTLLESSGDDMQAYQVPVRNRQCPA